MQDLVDQLLGNRYQLVQFLGSGGMGSVYRAVDRTLQRDVAIKVLHAGLAQNQESQDRFRQEARIAARLRHPNIVGVHDFGQDGDIFYIAMELILGDNLRQMMNKMHRQRQWIVLSEAIQLIRELALALDYAHKQGVLHRDIKPANIMIKDETVADLAYQPVITDLGLAKLGGSGFQTRVGSTMGTPAYMSPEQTMGKDVDERSDIYSLGVLFYELAAKQLPFPAKNLTEALRYHRHEEPPPLSKFRPDMPAAVEQIIMKTLAKDPNQRYGSAGELARALVSLPSTAFLDTVPSTATAGASSFKTYYQLYRVEPLENAVPDLLVDVADVDFIEIVSPTAGKRNVEVRARRLTLGRHTRNDIVLADQSVSRHHAQIEFDGARYLITDLGSANGTYLAQTRLHPNSPTPWKANEGVRVGNYQLVLRRHAPNANVDIASASQPLPPDKGRSARGSERSDIRVTLSTSSSVVVPGGNIRVEINVSNRNDYPMPVRIEIENLPLAWVSTPTVDLTLAAQGRESSVVFIRPPKGTYTRPEHYTLTVSVYDEASAEAAVAMASATFDVLPFVQFESRVEAVGKRRKGFHTVSIHNQGNIVQKFTIIFKGEDGSISVHPAQSEMQLSPGQSETLTVQVNARRQWIGKDSRSFQVEIAASNGMSQSHRVPVLARPRLTRLTLLLFLFFLIMLMGSIWFLNAVEI